MAASNSGHFTRAASEALERILVATSPAPRAILLVEQAIRGVLQDSSRCGAMFFAIPSNTPVRRLQVHGF